MTNRLRQWIDLHLSDPLRTVYSRIDDDGVERGEVLVAQQA